MRDFQLPGRSPVIAANGIAASSHPLGTEAAIRILRDGGNAMDAAIACAVVLGLTEPASTGIGGDMFVLFSPAGSDEIKALNASGCAPAGLNANALRENGATEIGLNSPHAVTIPGAIDGFCRLNADWGRLDLAQVLEPAITLAENGVPVSPRVAHDWAVTGQVLSGDARRWYLNGDAPFQTGQLWRHSGQAEVLRRVAQQGRDAFYEGEIAQDMVTSLQAMGGTHTMEDFAACASFYTDPISGPYRGYELVQHRPNGQGATAILMARMLEHFHLGGLDPWGAKRAHIEAEVAKLAYDARDRFIADPDHTTRLDHMISKETAAQLAALVDLERANPAVEAATGAIHKDTVYLTVVDRDLMAVSLIYSTFHAFGSGLASDKFGILFQNRGAGFSLQEGHPNEAAPKKRPMHTIIPGMVRKQGKVVMPFGVMGGHYQPTGQVRVLSNMLDFGMDVQEALDGPRSFYEDGQLLMERGYDPDILHTLGGLGHDVHTPPNPIGGGQAIWIDHANGTLHAGSDPRKDGLALGY